MIVAFLPLLFTSCSFNKLFLQPVKLDPTKTEYRIVRPNDTTIVALDTSFYHQPTFLTSERDTIFHTYTTKSVFFKNDKGHSLNGWWLRPKDGKMKGTVIHFHGNSSSLLHQYQLISPLAEEGFEVFMFDYSSYGYSEGKRKRKVLPNDGKNALDYVLQNRMSTGKIILYGQSLGGNLSTVVATRYQDKIDGLVVEGGFSSHKGMGKAIAGGFGKAMVKEQYSSIGSIKDFHKPVLFIYSTEDKIIPFYMGEELYEAANEPKLFMKVDKPHVRGLIFHREAIINQINEFFQF